MNEQFDLDILENEDNTLKSDALHGDVSAYIPTLTFLSGPSIGREIPIVHRQITLGRGNDCDIIVADPAVSRKHLEISSRKIVKKGETAKLKVVLKDLGSKNGTLINYSPVKQAVLQPEDKIILGRIILKFEHRDLAEQKFFDEIYRLATVDSLTSLYNKATITRILKEEIAGGLRYRHWISVIMIDIDRFKSLNDIYGHLKADHILQSVSDTIRSTVRRRDKVGRFGGDEFLIVLPETGEKGALRLAERVRTRLESTVGRDIGIPDTISVSLGVASRKSTDTDPEKLLENADTALLRSKSLGRNRVELWKQADFSKAAGS